MFLLVKFLGKCFTHEEGITVFCQTLISFPNKKIWTLWYLIQYLESHNHQKRWHGVCKSGSTISFPKTVVFIRSVSGRVSLVPCSLSGQLVSSKTQKRLFLDFFGKQSVFHESLMSLLLKNFDMQTVRLFKLVVEIFELRRIWKSCGMKPFGVCHFDVSLVFAETVCGVFGF